MAAIATSARQQGLLDGRLKSEVGFLLLPRFSRVPDYRAGGTTTTVPPPEVAGAEEVSGTGPLEKPDLPGVERDEVGPREIERDADRDATERHPPLRREIEVRLQRRYCRHTTCSPCHPGGMAGLSCS